MTKVSSIPTGIVIAEAIIPYARSDPYDAVGILGGVLTAIVGMVPTHDRFEFFERVVEEMRSELEKSAGELA